MRAVDYASYKNWLAVVCVCCCVSPGGHLRLGCIRYANGDEELYDHDTDPHEWSNLAGPSEFASVKKKLAQYLPKE